MSETDQDLAKLAALGDVKSFEILLERHYDKIYRLCYKMTNKKEVSEDITQDICVSLSVKLKGFEGRSQFTTWLYRVVKNTVYDYRRREQRYDNAKVGFGDILEDRTSSEDEIRIFSMWLSQSVQSLPLDIRDTLALFLEGFSQSEIGEILEVPEGTISWRVSEAKKRLKTIKEGEDNV